MITRKPWFGPRRFGYGWTPITPEGWLTAGAAIVCVIASIAVLPVAWKVPASLIISVMLCGVCWLTSGPPGHVGAPIRGRSVRDRKRIYRATHPDDPSIGEAVDRFDGPYATHSNGPPPELR